MGRKGFSTAGIEERKRLRLERELRADAAGQSVELMRMSRMWGDQAMLFLVVGGKPHRLGKYSLPLSDRDWGEVLHAARHVVTNSAAADGDDHQEQLEEAPGVPFMKELDVGPRAGTRTYPPPGPGGAPTTRRRPRATYASLRAKYGSQGRESSPDWPSDEYTVLGEGVVDDMERDALQLLQELLRPQ